MTTYITVRTKVKAFANSSSRPETVSPDCLREHIQFLYTSIPAEYMPATTFAEVLLGENVPENETIGDRFYSFLKSNCSKPLELNFRLYNIVELSSRLEEYARSCAKTKSPMEFEKFLTEISIPGHPSNYNFKYAPQFLMIACLEFLAHNNRTLTTKELRYFASWEFAHCLIKTDRLSVTKVSDIRTLLLDLADGKLFV